MANMNSSVITYYFASSSSFFITSPASLTFSFLIVHVVEKFAGTEASSILVTLFFDPRYVHKINQTIMAIINKIMNLFLDFSMRCYYKLNF